MCGMFRWKWPRVLLLGSAPLGGDVRKAASCHRGSRGCDSETMSRLTLRTSACLVNATLCKDLWRHKRKERQGETGRRRSGEGDPPGAHCLPPCFPGGRPVGALVFALMEASGCSDSSILSRLIHCAPQKPLRHSHDDWERRQGVLGPERCQT